jgi:hypothetical protein
MHSSPLFSFKLQIVLSFLCTRRYVLCLDILKNNIDIKIRMTYYLNRGNSVVTLVYSSVARACSVTGGRYIHTSN